MHRHDMRSKFLEEIVCPMFVNVVCVSVFVCEDMTTYKIGGLMRGVGKRREMSNVLHFFNCVCQKLDQIKESYPNIL